jgi:hypothetical protein
VVLGGLPALPFMGARFLISGAVLCAVLRGRRGPGALAVDRRQLAGTALISMLLLFIGNGFVALAEVNLPSGLAALLVSMAPAVDGDLLDHGRQPEQTDHPVGDRGRASPAPPSWPGPGLIRGRSPGGRSPWPEPEPEPAAR